ncbi:MAG: ADP-ribosylation factor-like protein [Proteobacteria bacterium]|nr:ADP-ribosylation factor-like protein [Pseudomonadota bacterium]
MAELSPDGTEAIARIVYWGAEGSGKTTNLRTIHARMKANKRGELREVPTRLDPTIHYEALPIELGEVNGIRTRIHLIAVPGAPEQRPTRKQLLDQVDGVVLVVDSQADRIDANLSAFEELRQGLAAYGRSLDSIPVVIQYNKHDLEDSFALEELHKKLQLESAAVFQSVATEWSAVRQTLTTISKNVVRAMRTVPAAPPPPPALPDPVPVYDPDSLSSRAEAPPEPVPADLMEEAILAEAAQPVEAQALNAQAMETQLALDRPWEDLAGEAAKPTSMRLDGDLRIVSVGQPVLDPPRGLRVPVVLGNSDGQTASLAITIQLDPLLDPET